MSTTELKTSLHHLIEQEEDELLLGSVRQILEQGRHQPVDELGGQTVAEFNQEMNDAEMEIDGGEYSSQEEVTARFEQIFKR